MFGVDTNAEENMAVTERIQVYVSPKDKKNIARAAKAHGEKSSEFIRRLVKEHLAEEHAMENVK